jgi:bifunctional UDP-N-acetylglucosamine pyrophosphorylase/glucosamine-1-phosphate N-acetyltransferase
MLTVRVADPTGYGRMVRDAGGRVLRVVEQKDATLAERAIDEVNPGIYLARAAFLREAVAALTPNNAQGELYLTDTIALLKAEGRPITALKVDDAREVLGVNTQDQLAEAERAFDARAREGQ